MAYGKLANKGRYGDTEIRNVAGRKSHVNKKEAGLIDLYGMLGENLVQRKGAGTRNPMTGMPEYHDKWYWHTHALDDIGESIKEFAGINDLSDAVTGVGDYISEGYDYWAGEALEAGVDYMMKDSKGSGNYKKTVEKNFDKEAYSQALTAGTQKEYLKGIGVPENKLEYFESNINMDELGFAQDRYSTGTQALSQQTGSSLGDIYSQTEQIEGSSGLESSGLIDYAKTKATKGVMGDYLNQQQALQTQLTSSKSTFTQGATDEFWANLENIPT